MIDAVPKPTVRDRHGHAMYESVVFFKLRQHGMRKQDCFQLLDLARLPGMTSLNQNDSADLIRRLAHVRWIAGGTGAGKSTLSRVLAERYDVFVYDGDLAEHRYIQRCTPQRHPYMCALLQTPLEHRWTGRTPDELFQSMPSLHGETFGLVIEDLLTLPTDRPVLVDDFRTLPADVAPLLTWREQAVFLLPTPEFRRHALGTRFADPARARANWGNSDHAEAMVNRLGRDELWDEEVRRQALRQDLPVLDIDGSQDVDESAGDLAAMFLLAGN
ncbi:hypothetical protein [Streptosporangium sp. NPDC000396]|uniref:hypothetical protein n=1 Tax=Streptosporangium sp. NPDC000396 TaxID=3366185 RepID=UPI0036B193D4